MEFNGHRLTKSYYHAVDSKYPLCPYTLPELYEVAAQRDDGKGIIWYRPAECYTHKELYSKAMAVAKGLLAIGLKRGDSMLMCGTEGADGLVMFMACSSLGIKVMVPYIYSPAKRTISQFMDAIEPKCVFAGNAHLGIELESVFKAVEELMAERQQDASLYHVAHCYHDTLVPEASKTSEHASLPLEKLIQAGDAVSDSELCEAKSLVGLNEPCVYAYTSGSTGRPKVTLISAANFSNTGIRMMSKYGVTKEMTIAGVDICMIDLAHLEFACASFAVGYQMLVYPFPVDWKNDEKTITELLEATEKHRPYYIHMDQFYLAHVVSNKQIRERFDLSSTRGALIAGSMSSDSYKRELMKIFPESFDCYGLTEFMYICSSRPGENNTKLQSIGKPYPNTEVMVVDEKGRCVPVNTEGEIYARGYCTFIEYKDKPELTEAAKTPDGWFKTGDCGIMDEDGDLRIIGRMAHTERLKVFSDVVYVGPIENLIFDLPEVADCAVIGLPLGGAAGVKIVYCIVLHTKGSLNIEDIKNYAKEMMPHQNCLPFKIFFFDNLPREGGRHKVSRRKLQAEVEKIVQVDSTAGDVTY